MKYNPERESCPPDDDVLYWASWTLMQYQRNAKFTQWHLDHLERQLGE